MVMGLGEPNTPAGFANAPPIAFATLAATVLFSALVLLAIYRSPRNKLAFRIEASDRELQNLHDRYANATASRAFAYGLLSLLVPLLAPFSLAMGLKALAKADQEAWPPVGGRARAKWGLGFSIVSLLVWLGVVIMLVIG
jgi:hypothetical protein